MTDLISSRGLRYIVFTRPKKKRFYIDWLVAKAFCDGYQEGYEVRHKDGNLLNNLASNLEWYKPDKIKKKINTSHSRTKGPVLVINPDTYEQVEYSCAQEAAKALGVHVGRIYDCCNGRQKTCQG